MLADPQSITVNSVAKSLPAVERARLKSEYRESGNEHELLIQTTEGKRDRSMIKINHTSTAADPLTAETAEVSMSAYLVIDRPKWGFSNTEIDYIVQALCDWSTTSNITAVLSGES